MDGAEKGHLLKEVPFVLDIPLEAQNNNHKSDKENKLDKLHRAWQSQALQALRVAAVFEHAMNGNEVEFPAEELFLRLVALLGDLETKIRDHRKRVSMPHAVMKDNPLFGKDDLAVAALQQKVNKQGGYNNNNNDFVAAVVADIPTPMGKVTGAIKEDVAAPTIKDNKDIIKEDITPTKIPDMASKAEAVRPRAENDGTLPIPRRFHAHRRWWRRNAPKKFARLFHQGLLPGFNCGKIHSNAALPLKGSPEYRAGYETVLGYVSHGVFRKLEAWEIPLVLFEVPWFVIPKGDSDKWRFITNLRQLNRHLRLKRFSLDTWRSNFPMLRKNQYACKVDLKDAYFHVPLSSELQRYVCVRFGDEVFQFLAMPFGISVAPAVWTSVMDVCAAIWRKHSLLVYVYFDDILILGDDPVACASARDFVLQCLLLSLLPLHSVPGRVPY